MCSNTRLTRSYAKECPHTKLKEYIINSWPSKRNEFSQDIQLYWNLRDNLAIIDLVKMKGKRIILPTELQQQALDQFHNKTWIEERQGS